MKQTLVAAAKKLDDSGIPVNNLLVLSETSKRDKLIDYLREVNPKKFSNTLSKEITYREYIWQYCIDEEFKVGDKPIEIDFYTEQEMTDENGDEYPAIEKLVETLKSKSDYISHLLIGSGGMGKSSLCLSLINKLTESDNIPFLISSEEIRKYCEDNNYNPHRINDIFDLYEIQAKCNFHLNVLDRKKFDLALLSGSLTIIIDGLDELPSIFGEKFDTRLFLESVSSIHSELGNSRILITSRDHNLLNDEEMDMLNINKFELLGFQEKDCIRYVRKRFRDIYTTEELNDICRDIVSKIKDTSFYEDGRIVPFFIDVVCNIYEEYEGFEGTDIASSEDIPYKCLNNVTDGIIYSIFERETIRHSIPIPSIDVFDIFCHFSAMYGKRWDVEQVEQYISMMYGEHQKYKSIVNSIFINPLLVKLNNSVMLKYDFTLSYFNTIYVIENTVKKNIQSEFLELLAKTSYESTVFYDLKEYLRLNSINANDIAKTIIASINKGKGDNDCRFTTAKNNSAIEFLFYLSVMCVKNPDRASTTENYKYIYGGDIPNTINNGYVKGDIPPIDFSSLTVINSKFSDYPNFMNSSFSDSSFIYTIFERCFNESIKKSELLSAEIDTDSCELGDLKEALLMLKQKDKLDNERVIEECRKFLGSFTRGQSYRDNNEVHIRFSKVVKGLYRTEFKKILKKGFVILNADKEVDKFYALSPTFKRSARRFVLNGTKDQKVKEFISFVLEE
ncbi:NACHT domain-containing protein [Vibrio crassostreae]|nr:NACHT domain-containing protein [Vibrio crassostreae]CAK2317855.1 NACHT domain-containing protein [Vibrio crassostreae]CAK2486200.1 NACHT domain-containing protein [Vibrio crassostreae]CAK2846711.1 NACHT domain-containing protein [Vibrio crassostreae]